MEGVFGVRHVSVSNIDTTPTHGHIQIFHFIKLSQVSTCQCYVRVCVSDSNLSYFSNISTYLAKTQHEIFLGFTSRGAKIDSQNIELILSCLVAFE
jgi:hypothetical protein